MALPEMKKPMYLAFRVSEDAFHVFMVLAWKVRTDYLIRAEDKKCGCALFRHEGKCEHVALVNKTTNMTFTKAGTALASEPIPWQTNTPMSCVAVAVADGEPMVMASSLPDVSVADVVNAVAFDASGPRTGAGFLNPNRLYAECKKSVTDSIAVNDPAVLAAGKTAAPFDPSTVDEKFADDLGADPFGAGSVAEVDDDGNPIEPKVEEAPKPAPVKKSTKKPIWADIRRPNPANFYVEKDVWEAMLFGICEGRNVLLTGPSGSGKSELCYIAAKAASIKLEPFNMGAMSEPRTSLIGNTHFSKDKGTHFERSRFVRGIQALETDGVGCVLLDEVTRSQASAFNILMPLMDRQGYLSLDEAEDAAVIKRGAKVAILGTANVGLEYTGTEAMDKALKERFEITIDMWFPPRSNETQILLSRCEGLATKDAERLVEIADQQRNLARNDGEFVEMISTRMLIAAGCMIGAGMPFARASKFAIENLFNADGGDASERTKIKQLIQKGHGG